MASATKKTKERGTGSAIAIVGIGCRLPGARDHHQLFSNVRDGVSSIREITPDRWDPALHYSADIDAPNKSISKWCGLIEDPWCFDHGFFRVSPKEAKLMDPQQRVLLEETWHCIEDAGIPLLDLQRWKTAVFVGVMARDHLQRASQPSAAIESHSALGGYDCILANRVSHVLGLRGKSMAIDAACASSLVAIHEGILALRSGDADAVLAGGVSLDLHPWKYVSFSKARMLSPDGRCKTFDKDANGYVPGEGVAVVMLRRLEDAIADGQHIYGVVRGSAVNHVGAGATITAPSVSSQADVIRTALLRAGVDPSTVTYVEAHGTGTSLGDPIEIEALTTAFREKTDQRQFCLVGSLKTNIGHLEATAGVAGVIKVLMMMRERQVPPSLNVRTLNPLIDFDSSPFRVALDLSPWMPAARDLPLRAGVSSFGMGGVNSHLVIEEYRAAPKTKARAAAATVAARARQAEPFVLSARTRDRLDALVERWRDLEASGALAGLSLTDICGTLATARATHAARLGGLVRTHDDLRALLARGASDHVPAARFAVVLGNDASVKAASALMLALADRGARPAFVAGAGNGLIAALVASSMLTEGAATRLLRVARGNARVEPPSLRRPLVPLLDLVSGRLIASFDIDPVYFQDLAARARVSPAEAARLRSDAALLASSQFTFRGHLEEWNRALVAAGAQPFFRDGELLPLPGSEPKHVLVASLAIQNALDRVNRKWSLPRARVVRDSASDELLDLLLDGVVGVEALAGVLLNRPVAMDSAVSEARSNVDRIDSTRPYAALHARNVAPHELGDVSRWLERARAAEMPSRLDVPVLVAGAHGGRARMADSLPVDRDDAHDGGLDDALMALWVRGVGVNWQQAFAGRMRARLPLPTYPFSRDRHVLGAEASVGGAVAALTPSASASAASASPPATAELVALRPRWVEPRDPADAALHKTPRGGVLVFLDASDDATKARAAFGARRLHVVRYGNAFRVEADGSFSVREGDAEDHAALLDALATQPGGVPDHVVHLASFSAGVRNATTATQMERGVLAVFVIVRAYMDRRDAGELRVIFAHPVDERGCAVPAFAAVDGFARSLRRENPRLSVTSLAVDGDMWTAAAGELARDDRPSAVRWERGHRRVRGYEPRPNDGPGADLINARIGPGAVWLITGGGGGLGLLFAEHLVTRRAARVVLAGRSAEGAALAARLSELNRSGVRCLYERADVTLHADVDALVRKARSTFGRIDAVIHAAGTSRDGFVLKKSAGDLRDVIGPKALGAELLDLATRDDGIALFAVFSSLVGSTGNVGQADYAAANSFLDAFAEQREARRAIGERSGATFALGWPLWDGGGMSVRAGTSTIFSEEEGLLPMPATLGIAAFEAIIAGEPGVVPILYGHAATALGLLADGAHPGATTRAAARRTAHGGGHRLDATALLSKTKTYLQARFSDLLGTAAADIDPELGLEELGLDSILVNQFNRRLDRDIGGVSKTILFECRTIAGVAAMLVKLHDEALSRLFGDDVGAPERELDTKQAPPSTASSEPSPRTRREREEIAIIGVAGRYPQARDLDAFWQNLSAGRDCVAEIPGERWDVRSFDAIEGGGIYCKQGGFVDGADEFDPLFFNVSPRDAELMDPQERLFLETAWSTFENAGYTSARLARASVGVWAGVTTHSYLLWGPDQWRKGQPEIPTSLAWTVANRVSYWFDLHGPSMPVDTACAAALTAVHLACESLRKGECEMALAGGVNLYLHPAKYQWLCQMQMLSKAGRCHSFGAAADGFVPGEGVGAILLKPLRQAIADGDRIWGIVKGSAVNHGGRTSGFTVPNPNAQAELVTTALRDAGVAASTIGYVEAHGTGTALGDPIEIAGLTRAFGDGGVSAASTCAIGSVKSNIGHLESAAGIAGLTKVLLQMRHRTLVPSLHSGRTNPKIDFAASPFRVQQSVADWTPMGDHPLRAGVSAFGAGGANAHVVLEAYDGPVPAAYDAPGDHVFVLSAKNHERLCAYASIMARFLEREGGSLRAAEVAHQLQVRREPLEERIALVAGDLAGVARALEAFGSSGVVPPGAIAGNVRSKKNGRPASEVRAELERGVAGALARRDARALAEAWVAGAAVDFSALYTHSVRHVDLPPYPFARERFWVGARPAEGGTSTTPTPMPTLPLPLPPAAGATRGVHPFLAAGPRAADDLRFHVDLDGTELCLVDHFVGDAKIFPAVGYIEMARAAMQASGRTALRIKNNVWSSAIVVGAEPRRIEIALTPIAGGASYEVFSAGPSGERNVHGQGKIDEGEAPVEERLDVSAIRSRAASSVPGAELYERLHELGLRLGPSYQAIRRISFGDGEALSEIEAPEHLDGELARFVLHPCLADAALQGALGLLDRRERLEVLHIPFSIGEVEIRGPVPRHCFAHVVLKTATATGKKMEVRVCDAGGRVVVVIRDFWLRAWHRSVPKSSTSKAGVFLRSSWATTPVARRAPSDEVLVFARPGAPAPGFTLVSAGAAGGVPRRLGERAWEIDPADARHYDALLREVAAVGGPVRDVVFAWPASSFRGDAASAVAQIDEAVLPLARLVQALLRSPDKSRIRLVCAIPGAPAVVEPCWEAIGGLLRTAALESGRIAAAVVELPAAELATPPALATLVRELEALGSGVVEIRHRAGVRTIKQLSEHVATKLDSRSTLIREGGTYIITGGAGGLGAIVAELFARARGRLVLVGRSERSAATDAILARLRAAGGDARYVRADIAQIDQARSVVREAKATFGALHGIVHSAGVLADAFLLKKTDDQWRNVLAPKVLGAINLDAAAAEEPLDFFALFASIAGVTGSAGQADYAYANAFLDAFARVRETRRASGERKGKTVSIDWTLWRDGGMHVDEATEQSLLATFGLRPLDTATGVAAFAAALDAPSGALLFVPGDATKVRAMFDRNGPAAPAAHAAAPAATPITTSDVRVAPSLPREAGMTKRLHSELIGLIAKVSKVDARRLDATRSLSEYGFDSIAFTRLANEINGRFGTDVTPALFFEHTTVAEVAAHLEDVHRVAVESALVAAPVAPVAQAPAREAAAPAPAPISAARAAVVAAVAEVAKLTASRIDVEAEIAGYGLDSIAFTRLANALNKAHGLDLTPAIFFEYTTIAAFAAHLAAEHGERFAAPAQVAAGVLPAPAAPPAPPAPAAAPPAAAPAPARAVAPREAIAIVGMHGLMPQSEDLDEFWTHLDAGRNLVTEIPRDRWDWRQYFGDPQKEPNKTNSKWGGFLRAVDEFDASFFGISPREAELMDPQQRLFLQTVYKAVEDAGYKPSDLKRSRTGLFVGASTHDYYELLRDAGLPIEAYTTTGMFHAILANRVSFLLDLHGPSFPIDTACSSSLVALRTAVEALWAGSCELAVVGGVSLLMSPSIYISFARAGMLSPEGRCKAFDKDANGYVRGEGVGAILLKPLSRAVADGDHIHAVIRGSSVNHGGRVNTMTTPNPNAQAELIVRAFEEAEVDPETVGYMEMHGTGTALGDPIEVNGLKKAFKDLRARAGRSELVEPRCGIGSVKTNIGHLEAAAGMSGIFKVILAMKHGRIPPTRNLTEVNPYIKLDRSPLYLVRETTEWKRPLDASGAELPRRAGISSFGFGGVNGHVLLEEHLPSQEHAGREIHGREHVFVLSAKTDERLRAYAASMSRFLEATSAASSAAASSSAASILSPAASEVERELVAGSSVVLGVDASELFADEDLETLGFDAARRVQLWQWIAARWGVGRDATVEGSCTSLAAIARHVAAAAAGNDASPAGRAPHAVALASIAYTLQVGREAMDHRLAIIASSHDELAERLRAVSTGAATAGSPGVSIGHLGHLDEGGTGDAPDAAAIEQLLASRSLASLAAAWVAGASVPWAALYEQKPRRASLPSYPFARTRFWVPTRRGTQPKRAAHPLLETSAKGDLERGLVFEKRLAATDAIVREHRVAGRAVLPGVAHLEMARVALVAAGVDRFRLEDIVWLDALDVPDEGRDVIVRLLRSGAALTYEVQAVRDDVPTTCSRGRCVELTGESREVPAALDSLDTLRGRCPRRLDAAAVYDLFRAIDLDYGPSFQGIREVWIGNGEAVARVDAGGEIAPYTLHPTLMDAALQTMSVIGLAASGRDAGTRLPFSVDSLELSAPLSRSGFIHVRELGPDRFDVDVRDDAGALCVALRDVAVRRAKDPLAQFFYVPEWQRSSITAAATAAVTPPGAVLIVHPASAQALADAIAARHAGAHVHRIVVGSKTTPLGDRVWEIDASDPTAVRGPLRAVGPVASVWFLGSASTGTNDRLLTPDEVMTAQTGSVIGLFRLVKELAAADLVQHVAAVHVLVADVHDVDGPASNPLAAGLLGLVKSLAKEYPRIAFRCVDIGLPPAAQLASVVDAVLAEPAQRSNEEIAYRDGARWVKRLRPATLPRPAQSRFVRGGVYIIVGGASGIGLAVAEHLADTAKAKLVLVGRRARSAETDARLAALVRKGGEAVHAQADVCDARRMKEVFDETRARWGAIDGVFHGALVLEDGIVERMSEASFRAALEPKAAGTAVLASLLAEGPPALLFVLSSVQSFTGSAGQSNYAAGCTFMDAYARHVARCTRTTVRVVNWGFWGSIGSVASTEYRERLAARGYGSIAQNEGIDAIERIAASGQAQVVAIKASRDVLASIGVLSEDERGAAVAPAASLHDAGVLRASRELDDEATGFGRYLALGVLGGLQRAGVLVDAGERHVRSEIGSSIGARPSYRRLMDALLDILGRSGFVTFEGDRVVTTALAVDTSTRGDIAALGHRERELRTRHPNLGARLDLAAACLGSLPEIITGKVLATEVMFPSASVDLVGKVYRGETLVDHCNALVAAAVLARVESRAAHDPTAELRILEVGAGTGGTTADVISALERHPGRVTYDFTDLSVRFLKRAEQTFADRSVRIRCRMLDIEKPVDAQGFDAGGYDIVIAANVLHATRDLRATLANVRALLRPGGSLVLNEVTRAQDFHTVTFGLLDGWWLHDDDAGRIPGSPLLDRRAWGLRLAEAGFGEVDALGSTLDGRELPQSVILAEAVALAAAERPALTTTTTTTAHGNGSGNGRANGNGHGHSPQAEPARSDASPGGPMSEKRLREAIAGVVAECLGMSPSEVHHDKALSSIGVDSIVGVEVINKLNETLGVVLRTIVVFDHPTVRQLAAHIRATHGDKVEVRVAATAAAPVASAPRPAAPPADLRRQVEDTIVTAVAAGVGTAATEIDRKRALSSLGVDSIVGVEIVNRIGAELGIVLKTIAIFDYPNVIELAAHIVERHGSALRLAGAAAPAPAPAPAPAHAPAHVPAPPPRPRADDATTGYRAVLFERPGSPRDLRIVNVAPRELAPNEVEILVKAFPINFSDFLLAKGLYPIMPEFPFTPGVEVSGVVHRVGPAVASLRAGDEVIGLTRPEMGGQGSLVVTDDTFVVKKPGNVSHADACGFPVAFLAMYLALEKAAVKKGERVLINAAAGTNGLMAIQLARLMGAEVFATVGSRRKVEFLTKMGVPHVLNYREVDFGREVLSRTGGHGADVIIDIVAGESLQRGLDILAPDGRYAEIAVFGLQTSKALDLSHLVDNQTFFSLNTKKFFLKHPGERTRYLGIMASYLESGKIAPITAAVYPFERVREAYAAKDDRETIGRIVVTTADVADAPLALPPPRELPARHGPRAGAEPMDIAIVGLSGRFPGARDVDALWDKLAAGESMVTEVPASRWANSRYFDPDPLRLDRTYCRSGGFLDEIDAFDAGFFNVSGKEAAQTDPQQRLFLEEAYKAFEDAGQTRKTLGGTRCGVFVGVGASDYITRMNAAGVSKEAQSFWGNEASILAARISYFLDLKGPSIAVNTACSSSLVALHLACQSLRTGDVEMALVGGVFLSNAPDYFIVASNGNMLSPEGRCKTFDDSANGFGPGEAVAALVLRPLEAALADGDQIYGVIRGTAINQDGKTNGITAPSARAQTAVELAVYDGFGIPPSTIGLVEAHGTGTKLGDPIEIEGLTNAFRKHTEEKQFCAIGSIKTNIGHTAAAAGVCGIAKILLAFRNEQIPASLGFQTPNRYIDFASSPFFVNTELRAWPRSPTSPRRAAVSSFGFSGTNAHAVLEEPPATTFHRARERDGYLVPLSAETPSALARRAGDLARWLERASSVRLADLAYNLQVHRDHHAHRAAWFVRDASELLGALRAFASTGDAPALEAAASSLAGTVVRWLAGDDVDFREEFHGGEHASRLRLPTYPFDRERHWFTDHDTTYGAADPGEVASAAPRARDHELTTVLSPTDFFLDAHRVDGARVLPGAFYLELARRAAAASGLRECVLRNVYWLRPVVVDGGSLDIVTAIQDEAGTVAFEVRAGTIVHARGSIEQEPSRPAQARHDLAALARRCPKLYTRAEHYEALRKSGLVHGAELSAVEELRIGENEAFARLELPREVEASERSFGLHPALIDSALQVAVALGAGGPASGRPLPFSVDEVLVVAAIPARCYVHAVASAATPAAMRSIDIALLDSYGNVVVELRGFTMKSPAVRPARPAPDKESDLLAALRRLEAGEIGEDEVQQMLEVPGE